MGLELIIMVGAPCAGKTTFAKTHYPGHYLVNLDSIHELLAQKGSHRYDWWDRDFARTIEKHMVCKRLSLGISIVVDNTPNVLREERAKYMPFAYHYGAVPIAVYFPPNRHLCVERNWKRKEESGLFVPNDGIFEMLERMEPPTIEEGFAKIISGLYFE